MFRRLKARAAAMNAIATLLTRAEELARRRGAERPAAEHLVLAALQLPDGTAARALERIGSSAGAFASALDAQDADDLARVGVRTDDDRIRSELPPPGTPRGVFESEPSARDLFQAAGADARHGGGSLVGAHVLRAAAALEAGPLTGRPPGRCAVWASTGGSFERQRATRSRRATP